MAGMENFVRTQLREQGYTFTPEEVAENARMRKAKLFWVGTTIPRSVPFKKLKWRLKWHVIKEVVREILRDRSEIPLNGKS